MRGGITMTRPRLSTAEEIEIKHGNKEVLAAFKTVEGWNVQMVELRNPYPGKQNRVKTYVVRHLASLYPETLWPAFFMASETLIIVMLMRKNLSWETMRRQVFEDRRLLAAPLYLKGVPPNEFPNMDNHFRALTELQEALKCQMKDMTEDEKNLTVLDVK